MGFFGISNEEASEISRKVALTIGNIEHQYKEVSEQDEDDIHEVFEIAFNLLESESVNKLAKTVKKSKQSEEACAMNIIQNSALSCIMQETKFSFIGTAQVAYDIYNFVNEKNLKNGYIDLKQFHENRDVVEKIRYGSI